MKISWKTDGSAEALATMQSRLEDLDLNRAYATWADANGRTGFKWEVKGETLFITEEWSITREEYDAFVANGTIDHSLMSTNSIPVSETTDHLVI